MGNGLSTSRRLNGSHQGRKDLKVFARVTQKAEELNRNSTKAFQYDVLQDDWIRLLDLMPGSGDDLLICALSAKPLSDKAISFQAIRRIVRMGRHNPDKQDHMQLESTFPP
jgi:hypothetical protein